MTIEAVRRSHRRQQDARKPISFTQREATSAQTNEAYIAQLFSEATREFKSHPQELENVCSGFKTALGTVSNKVLLNELKDRLNYTDRKLPSQAHRVALELLEDAWKGDPGFIPDVMTTLFDIENENWKCQLNNLITMMQSPTAVLKLLLSLYQHTEDMNIKEEIVKIINTPFVLYTDDAVDERYSFYHPQLQGITSVPNRYDAREHDFFKDLTSYDIESMMILIRKRILSIPSETATELAHRVKSQVVAEILDKEYNDHQSTRTLYTPEQRSTFLAECAEVNSPLRQFSDIPTTYLPWKKKKQTRSSRTLQEAATSAGIDWQSNGLQLGSSSSASSSASSLFSGQQAAPTGGNSLRIFN